VIAQAQCIDAIKSMSVTNSQRVHHHKTNSYQHSLTSACISKVTRIRY